MICIEGSRGDLFFFITFWAAAIFSFVIKQMSNFCLLVKDPHESCLFLRFFPNALLLPHLGYVTVENYALFYTQMLENLDSCFENKPLRKLI